MIHSPSAWTSYIFTHLTGDTPLSHLLTQVPDQMKREGEKLKNEIVPETRTNQTRLRDVTEALSQLIQRVNLNSRSV